MKFEFDVVQRNRTWTLISRSPDDNMTNTIWVFKVKQNEDGIVERLKECLVANGMRK